MKTKFEKASDRVRGNEPMTEDELHQKLSGEGMLGVFDPGEWVKQLAADDLEAAPMLLTLKEGQTLAGILEGAGPEAEIIDRATGVAKMVGTWIVGSTDGRSRVSILDAAQLSKKLPGLVGGFVRIARGKDEKLDGGRQLTHYLVAGPALKDKDGNPVRRDWANGGALAGPGQKQLAAAKQGA